MNCKGLALSLLTVFGTVALQAEDLTPEVTAKFLRILVTSSGQNKIACGDAALKAALEAQGVTVDATSAIVWCTRPVDAKNYKAQGKLVVAGTRDMAGFAGVLITGENGRPKLTINTANLRSAKVTLGDTVMKMGEKVL